MVAQNGQMLRMGSSKGSGYISWIGHYQRFHGTFPHHLFDGVILGSMMPLGVEEMLPSCRCAVCTRTCALFSAGPLQSDAPSFVANDCALHYSRYC